MKRKVFVCSIMLSMGTYSYAQQQESDYNVPRIEELVTIPPSPEAAGFLKYGNTAVNLYTGSPEISIPIHTVQGRELTLPISLTYDASGVKVDQLASWVGLQWNLNAGGVVSRQIIGAPDDYYNAYPPYFPFYTPEVKDDYLFVRDFFPSEGTFYDRGLVKRYFEFIDETTYKKTNATKYDTQPDVYSFSVNGLSGTLYIDYENEVAHCVEHPDIKVVPILWNYLVNGVNIKVVKGWIITDNKGVIYEFEMEEITYLDENAEGNTQTKVYGSSWFLTKIRTANNRDIIQLFYSSPVEWIQPQLAGRAQMKMEYELGECGSSTGVVEHPSPTYKIRQFELLEVKVNGRRVVELISSETDRLDLQGRKSLKQINVFNLMGDELNEYKFSYSYFGNAQSSSEKSKRLKLDTVKIFGGDTSLPPQLYIFEYESPGSVPSRESLAQDYWGYFNGKSSNQTLIPYLFQYDENQYFAGGDRNADFSSGLVGTLSKITYPTGGETIFDYAPHKVSVSPRSQFTYFTPLTLYLQGGINELDPYNYRACDDASPFPPNGVEGAFIIEDGGQFDFTINITGTESGGNHVGYIAIYYIGELDCVPIPNGGSLCSYGELRTFCDLISNPPAPIFIQYGPMSPSVQNFTMFLPSGSYGAMMLNSNANLHIELSIIGVREIIDTVSVVGGLRVNKITDLEKGQPVNLRYFYYGDLSKKQPNQITEAFLLTNEGNGTLHAPLYFEEYKQVERYHIPQTGQPMIIDCSYLVRHSNNRAAANHYITYPVVSEVQFSATQSEAEFNGFSVTTFHNEIDSYTGYRFGKRTILNGRILSQKTYSKAGQLSSATTNTYLQVPVGGEVCFAFETDRTVAKNLQVKSLVSDTLSEFFVYDDKRWISGTTGTLIQGCVESGYNIVLTNYAEITNTSDPKYCQFGWVTNIRWSFLESFQNFLDSIDSIYNQPRRYINALDALDDLCGGHPDFESKSYGLITISNHKQTQIVSVTHPYYTIEYCNDNGIVYSKRSYLVPRYWAQTKSTRQVTYHGPDSVQQLTVYYYDNQDHYQLTRSESSGSDGKLIANEIKYPHDMPSPGASLLKLIEQNRLAEVVEQRKFSDNQLLLTRAVKFHEWTPNNVYPEELLFSTYTEPSETRLKIEAYDLVGNPTVGRSPDNDPTTYIWGYNNTYLVAQIVNATPSQLFYNSFEEGVGTSGIAVTGRRYYSGTSYTIPENERPSGPNLIMTYWYYDNEWKFQEAIPYQPTIANAGASRYDEIRVFPTGALMTTYSYEAGVGISSMCDPNNIVSYYEYDTFNRLKVVKDSKGTILSAYTYNYRN